MLVFVDAVIRIHVADQGELQLLPVRGHVPVQCRVDRDAGVLHAGHGGHVGAAVKRRWQVDRRQHDRQQGLAGVYVGRAIVEAFLLLCG